MLELRSLCKKFQTSTGNGRMALNNVTLSLQPNDFVTIIGSNGAGKSTLLNVIAGVFPADSGQIVIDGEDVTSLPEHRRASLMGRVFQDPMQGTAGSMSIEENMAMAYKRGMRRGLSKGVSVKHRDFFREKLATLGLGLEDRLQEPVKLLSGGQRQALALLMATLSRPKLLLLDEHTAALDPRTAQEIQELTNEIAGRGNLAVLMVTHNLRLALSVGTRTIMMHEGEIVLDVSDPERSEMTVSDLLKRFHDARGEQLSDDRILLEV
ncbi:MAG: ATP-binding cassette domain-containing protein [Bacillota bacterium]|jgi:putative ABC transport system ATP-binding protein|nr:ATP-binding cassette domain-containing protein [Bacillota bacterium]MDI9415072.1 ATP-binding cassette domain-containing protein [Bacillota bacterium]NLD12758.1 ATP-binding cassette domain-containing protein [Bacillota bacterium]HAV21889.1 ABC transporter ATP-binding protein [Bacillota bacterium]HCD41414.1 ABC transporter ATP-binding protein [Bacillota bacterium]